jgi:hypothetical protein
MYLEPRKKLVKEDRQELSSPLLLVMDAGKNIEVKDLNTYNKKRVLLLAFFVIKGIATPQKVLIYKIRS